MINEYLMAPQAGTTEWIELYNPTTSAIDLSGLYLDDIAGGGGAPKQLPAGTTIPPQGYYVLSFASGFLNNIGTEAVRYLAISGGSKRCTMRPPTPWEHPLRQGVSSDGRWRQLVRGDLDQCHCWGG